MGCQRSWPLRCRQSRTPSCPSRSPPRTGQSGACCSPMKHKNNPVWELWQFISLFTISLENWAFWIRLNETQLTLTASRMEPMTTGTVGIGSPISSSVAGLSSSAQTFTMPSVGPSSRAMIRPWKPGFSYRTQLKRRNHVILHFSQNKHQRFQRTVQLHHLDKLKCAATLQWSGCLGLNQNGVFFH